MLSHWTAEGIKALVMELVKGPTLADRIVQGAIVGRNATKGGESDAL